MYPRHSFRHDVFCVGPQLICEVQTGTGLGKAVRTMRASRVGLSWQGAGFIIVLGLLVISVPHSLAQEDFACKSCLFEPNSTTPKTIRASGFHVRLLPAAPLLARYLRGLPLQ